MRKRTIAISLLLVIQFASAIAFTPFISHVLRIWYSRESGWGEAFQMEYAQGGWAMLVEFVIVGVAFLATIGFEIWLIVSSVKDEKEIKKQLDRIEKKLGNKDNVKSEPDIPK